MDVITSAGKANKEKTYNTGKWDAKEEKSLYEGIKKEGWGRWTAIATVHVKTRSMPQVSLSS